MKYEIYAMRIAPPRAAVLDLFLDGQPSPEGVSAAIRTEFDMHVSRVEATYDAKRFGNLYRVTVGNESGTLGQTIEFSSNDLLVVFPNNTGQIEVVPRDSGRFEGWERE